MKLIIFLTQLILFTSFLPSVESHSDKPPSHGKIFSHVELTVETGKYHEVNEEFREFLESTDEKNTQYTQHIYLAEVDKEDMKIP